MSNVRGFSREDPEDEEESSSLSQDDEEVAFTSTTHSVTSASTPHRIYPPPPGSPARRDEGPMLAKATNHVVFRSSRQLPRYTAGDQHHTAYGKYREHIQDQTKAIAQSQLPEEQETQSLFLRAINSAGEYLETGLARKLCYPVRKCLRCLRWAQLVSHYFTLYIAILAILCACFGAAMDWIIRGFEEEHFFLALSLTDENISGYVLWVSWTVGMIFMSMMFVFWVPAAAGSGVPEMKAILAGVKLDRYLSVKTLIAKVCSLTFAVGSGLMLGKEGPFVHVCSILAVQLTRLPIFHRIRRDPHLLHMMTAVGCGMGLAANFGSPIGGVLFSIEVTASYYAVDNYFWAFGCAGLSSLLFWFLTFEGVFIPTEFPPPPAWGYIELIFFALLGLWMGCLGALTSVIIRKIVLGKRFFLRLPKRLTSKLCGKHKFPKQVVSFVDNIMTHQVWWGILVSFIIGTATYPVSYRYVGFRGKHALQALFSLGDLEDAEGDWADSIGGIWFSMIWFFMTRWLGMAFCLTLPVASGLYIPSLAIGAVCGRFMGELLRLAFPEGAGFQAYEPTNAQEIFAGGYAVVGAAAMVGGFTHTLSAAVAILEITGQLSFLGPSILAVFIAVATSRYFTNSIYEQILLMKGLPFLPPLREALKTQKVQDYMKPASELGIIEEHNTNAYTVTRLLNKNLEQQLFPVVNNTTGVIVGQTSRPALTYYLLESQTKAAESTMSRRHQTTTMTHSVRFLVAKMLSRGRSTLGNKQKQVTLDVEWPPILINLETELHIVHMLFVALQLREAIITNSKGQVVGILDRETLSALGGRYTAKQMALQAIDSSVKASAQGYQRLVTTSATILHKRAKKATSNVAVTASDSESDSEGPSSATWSSSPN